MQTVDHTDRAASAPARRPWVLPAAIGAGVAAGTAAIWAIHPTDSGTPVCISRTAFGVDCPFCGGLRCVNSLARGDLLGAADHNVLLAVALPLAVVAWAVWLFCALTGRQIRWPRVPSAVWFALAALVVAFAVTRNLGTDGWMGWLAASTS